MRLIYFSHPEVVIDPAVPVPDWSLTAPGRARLAPLVALGWPGDGVRIVASPERKAQETAAALGRPFVTDPETGEIDRSSTGYLPAAEHERQADLLFAHPQDSANGWERAVDAQARMVAALARHGAGGDLLFVGHGAVGTLLWCHVSGRPIARAEDQPRGGCVWMAEGDQGGWRPLHPWRPVEALD
ncbi:histidine phosphatase family protein [Wenxinia marina]|uniref:Fructose-2,6-bisphosphatase n=1 Tax=Wenxinia marina DSM 24838 TaxID=1123501 RepID=A0A0D0Q8C0_9RHOB|nr:histidine phosphatase family protein [Wenxinia marina]KIQ68642.1 Fructose-2,6-bisphosphatase [Wenxinia marina DSM 24838]GGL67566.1 phosphoglycerate mutase [Wenxinia marina]